MKIHHDILYHEMLEAFNTHHAELDCEQQQVEVCFWTAGSYARMLKDQAKAAGFASLSDEIEFFKDTLPTFYHWVEYFLLLSEALLCVPDQKEAAVHYWSGELHRCQRFRERHADLVRYLEHRHTHRDGLYFVRTIVTLPIVGMVEALYDYDPHFCSEKDRIVRSYLAHQRYQGYCAARITTPHPGEKK